MGRTGLLLAILLISLKSFSLTTKSLKSNSIKYILTKGSDKICPEAEVSYFKDRGIVLGTNMLIENLDGKTREFGKKGLNCFLKKKKCEESSPNYYRRVRAFIVDKDNAVVVRTSDENWLYLDSARKLYTKELKIWDHKMEYKAKIFDIRSDKVSFKDSSVKLKKEISCFYRVR